MAAEADDSK